MIVGFWFLMRRMGGAGGPGSSDFQHWQGKAAFV
jgi:hypothetical protein